MTTRAVVRRHGVINAPERTDKSKRRLLPPVARARRILRWRRKRDIDFLGLIESGSIMAGVVAGRRRWLRTVYARPNTVIRGHKLGNGALLANDAYEVLDVGGFRARLKRRWLYMLVVLVRDKQTGHRSVHIVRHLPRNVERIDPRREARTAIDNATADHFAAYVKAGLPVACYSDSNGPPPRMPTAIAAVREGVESVVTSGFWVLNSDVDRLPGATDHGVGIWVDLKPNRIDVRTNKLPEVRR